MRLFKCCKKCCPSKRVIAFQAAPLLVYGLVISIPHIIQVYLASKTLADVTCERYGTPSCGTTEFYVFLFGGGITGVVFLFVLALSTILTISTSIRLYDWMKGKCCRKGDEAQSLIPPTDGELQSGCCQKVTSSIKSYLLNPDDLCKLFLVFSQFAIAGAAASALSLVMMLSILWGLVVVTDDPADPILTVKSAAKATGIIAKRFFVFCPISIAAAVIPAVLTTVLYSCYKHRFVRNAERSRRNQDQEMLDSRTAIQAL